MSVDALQAALGPLWPYAVVIIAGFLPTEIWRVLGVFAGRRLEEDSPVLEWVRLVAAALVAGVVAKLVLFPSGALAIIPWPARLGAIACGLLVLWLTRGRVLLALLAGLAALVGLALAI
jgi:branched-subunit amino acid transport protein